MLGRIGRVARGGLGAADRQRLLQQALNLHREMRSQEVVLEALKLGGASLDEAGSISAEAGARVDREVTSSVSLPRSAQRDVNYYFLLGLTPDAPIEEIHRAFRRKAREVHPDRHRGEFLEDQWQDVMTVVADASDVLSNPRKRRAYDVYWRERSHTVALRYRRKGEQRGDLQTRYLWNIAEMSRLEDAFSTRLDDLARRLAEGSSLCAPLQALHRALEQYEGTMIEVRTGAQALPEGMARFSDRVRAEMHRKERLVSALRELLPPNLDLFTSADVQAMRARIEPAITVLAEIRRAQGLFELGSARPFI